MLRIKKGLPVLVTKRVVFLVFGRLATYFSIAFTAVVLSGTLRASWLS